MKNKEIGLQTSQKFASIKIELVLYQVSLDSCLYRRMGTLLSAHLIHMLLTFIQQHRLHAIPILPTLQLFAFISIILEQITLTRR